MIARLVVAVVGACLITGALLLGMSEFTAIFRQHDGGKYFLITDILPAPDRGRPQRPPAAAMPPGRQVVEFDGNGAEVSLTAPDEPNRGLGQAPALALPALDAEDQD